MNTSGNKGQEWLIPYRYKIIGYISFALGLIASYLRFSRGIKPEFLETKVFAVYSKYFESSFLKIIGNNIGEEICLSLVVIGLLLIVISKEKLEYETFLLLRFKSIILAIIINSCLLFLTIWLIYGFAYIGVLAANIGSTLIIYYALFRILAYKYKRIKAD